MGILFDALTDTSVGFVWNNTFDLGKNGFILEMMAENKSEKPKTVNPSLTLNFTDNTIISAGNWLYIARDKVSDDTIYDYDLMLTGEIYNNNFSVVTSSFFSNATNITVNTTDSDLKWNTTPVSIGTYKKIRYRSDPPRRQLVAHAHPTAKQQTNT